MSGPSSIIGAQAVRISRLTADGTPDFDNPTGAFMLCGGISTFQHDFDLDTGADIFEKDASGAGCVIRKRQDLVKRVSFTLTMCKSDYRLDEILGVADAIVDGSNVVGRAFMTAQGCSNPDTKAGVAIELWSEQWDCDVPADVPYMRSILARAYLTPKGFTRQDGVSMPVYSGYATPNNNFGDGPFGDLDILADVHGWAMIDIDDTTVPTCPSPIGYVNIPGSAS